MGNEPSLRHNLLMTSCSEYVAAKVIPPPYSEHLGVIIAEFNICNALSHPNVIKVLELYVAVTLLALSFA